MPTHIRRRGFFIVFDGTDGSGKSTQLRLFVRRLRRNGQKVVIVDFPQYHRFFGRLIARMLEGEFGPIRKLNPYMVSLAYAADRWQASGRIKALLQQGTIVVADRYTTANMIHQGGKISDPKERRTYLSWVQDLEYRVLGIPRPDAVVFYDLPPRYARQIIRRGGRRADTADQDLRHQEESHRQALLLAKHAAGWHHISCVERGRVLSPEEIHELTWQAFFGHLRAVHG